MIRARNLFLLLFLSFSFNCVGQLVAGHSAFLFQPKKPNGQWVWYAPVLNGKFGHFPATRGAVDV